MNHKTRALAKSLYEQWYDEVSCYAFGHIASFEEAEGQFMEKAVRLKKTLAYRRGDYE